MLPRRNTKRVAKSRLARLLTLISDEERCEVRLTLPGDMHISTNQSGENHGLR